MFDTKTPPDGQTKEQVAIDLIWDLLDRNEVFPYLIIAWPGINDGVVCKKRITFFENDAGHIPPVFHYFLLKDLCDMNITQRVHRPARYMYAPNLEKYSEKYRNLLHSFFVIYILDERVFELAVEKEDVLMRANKT